MISQSQKSEKKLQTYLKFKLFYKVAEWRQAFAANPSEFWMNVDKQYVYSNCNAIITSVTEKIVCIYNKHCSFCDVSSTIHRKAIQLA